MILPLPEVTVQIIHTSWAVKPYSRLSTAREPCTCNTSWIQANFTLQEHIRR